jgi:5-formyltetrahydrofolate cyclo-ligase
MLLDRRRARRAPDLVDDARAITDRLLGTPEIMRAAVVACYVSVGSEPGTGRLLRMLDDLGKRVLLPVLNPDYALDWSVYSGDHALASAARGLVEPIGPRLGADAVVGADVVLAPALAVDHRGNRLGRGGGSYDRTLSRVAAGTWVCALVYDDEVLDSVPADRHDRTVDAIVTPARIVRLPLPARPTLRSVMHSEAQDPPEV